jgi:predicted secreted protein
MDIGSGLALYATILLVVVFMVLPFGAQAAEIQQKGHAASAPLRPRIGVKMLVAAGLSAALWLLAWLVITHTNFSLRDTL